MSASITRRGDLVVVSLPETHRGPCGVSDCAVRPSWRVTSIVRCVSVDMCTSHAAPFVEFVTSPAACSEIERQSAQNRPSRHESVAELSAQRPIESVTAGERTAAPGARHGKRSAAPGKQRPVSAA